MRIEPFRIEVRVADQEDLKRRIATARWPQPQPGAGWERGVDVDYLRDLADYWANKYDWSAWQSKLNEYPQFIATINDQPIHFLHIKSPHANALPLMLLHGWPGSFVEFLDIIEPLTNPADPADAFHLVIPSHPHFAFSTPVTEACWDSYRTAEAYAAIMAELGYDRYGVQGGDYGAIIGPDMGRIAPDNVVGVHVNAGSVGFIPFGELSDEEKAGLTDLERQRLARMVDFLETGSGYFQIQSTRPKTLGVGLADSPIGQLAWIMEKFQSWTFGDGLPEEAISRDHLLTNVSIYWFTNSGASAAHMYYEMMHSGRWPTPSQTPTGVINFGEDIALRTWGEQTNTIVRWTEVATGGHFAALEEPELLVSDVAEFFRDLR